MEYHKDSQKLIDLIFGSEIRVHTKAEKEFISNTFNCIQNIKCIEEADIDNESKYLQILKYEKPDLILIHNNNSVLAIEHFEVDSSKRNGKGSTFKQSYNKKHYSEKQKIIDERLKWEKMVISTEIVNTRLLYDNLFENTINSLDAHYEKIESYEKRIRANKKLTESNIDFIFFVEYCIMFPSFFINGKGSMVPVYPHNDSVFIENLKLKRKLTGLLFHFQSFNQFIMIKNNNLSEYGINERYIFDLSKKTIHDFEHPRISSVSSVLPNDI